MNDGLIVLKRIIVENANAISGVTWGFPAITNFLGFVHTISRKLKNQYDISLSGCAVISHEQHVHVHRPKKYGDFYFAMTRNPLTKKGETSPFNPEGRMHMTVSLVIPFFGRLPKNKNNLQEFTKHLKKIVCESRLAGGTIISFQDNVLADYYPENEDDLQKFENRILRMLRPGFALVSRKAQLEEHFLNQQKERMAKDRLDALLDLIAIKHQTIKVDEENLSEDKTEEKKVEWKRIPKPYKGWLVPIVIGYQGISELHPPNTTKNSRDPAVPFRFVEAAYTLGEWISPHRVSTIKDLLWKYAIDADRGSYLCENDCKEINNFI